jgi:tRNA(Ile)-lysidine synthase
MGKRSKESLMDSLNLNTLFKSLWQKQFPNWNPENIHLLLAVSGGVDSVVLVNLIKLAGFSYSIAHCNFQLRGLDSERDALFVSSLEGASEICIKKFNTTHYAEEHKIAIQEAARKLRYDWFADLMEEMHSKIGKQVLLVTAHHGDDNIETVLMNFFRGTGIQGLRGILPFQQDRSLIRPLLGFRKEQLINYAQENHLLYVEDVSNESDKYTRNFFRNQLIPQIQNIFPKVEENILENIERLKEVSNVYHDAIDSKLNKLCEQKGAEIHIPILKLKQEKSLTTIVWEMSKTFGFSAPQTSEIIKLMDSDNGAFISSLTHRIIKNRKWLIIAENEKPNAHYHIVEEADVNLNFSLGILQLTKLDFTSQEINPDSSFALLNQDKILFPLLLRKPRTGDYFYPLGMQKKKKISRFLMDLKLSKTQKENCWVLESNKRIVWVVGYRIDDRFKLQMNATNILQIQLKTKKL